MKSVINLTDQELLRRTGEWRNHDSLDSLSVAVVADIARTEGTDFATALLYRRITESERFAPCIDWIRRSPTSWPSSRSSPLLAVVPGAFHHEHMNTGADGRRFLEIAHGCGFRTEVISTHSFGSLAQNAQIVGEWLCSHRGDEIVMVTLSKAAAEMARLLRDGDRSLFANMIAILNLSPMIFGSQLVDRVLEHPLRRLFVRSFMWCKNYDFANLEELRYNRELSASPRSFVPTLNVNGFPMQRHLSSSMARRQYGRLRHYGPNDGGGVLLADTVHFPGTLLPVWGADHYLRYPEKFPYLLGQALCAITIDDQWAGTTRLR